MPRAGSWLRAAARPPAPCRRPAEAPGRRERGGSGSHRRQCLDGSPGPMFLEEAGHGVDDHRREDHQGVGALPHCQGQGRGTEEHPDEGVVDLTPEEGERALAAGPLDAVRAVAAQASLGLGLGKPALRASKEGQDGAGRLRVPGGRAYRFAGFAGRGHQGLRNERLRASAQPKWVPGNPRRSNRITLPSSLPSPGRESGPR